MTWCQVNGYHADKLDEALEGVKVVVIPAGVPRKVQFHLCVKNPVTDIVFFILAWRKLTLVLSPWRSLFLICAFLYNR